MPSQHDGKDAAVIAELSAQGKSAIWAWQPGGGGAGDSEQDQAMRYWVRRLDRQQRVKQMYCGQFEALLGRHWPESQRVLKPASGTLSRTLARWATPQALAADPAAAQALANIGGRWLKPGKIAALLEAARHTVGVRMTDWTAREMREVAQAIVDLRKQIAAARRALRALAADCPTIQAQAAAVGLATACVLHVCLGDVRNYPHAGAYRKAMGLNLTEHSSGRYKGKLRISKRGQRLCRKWIYFSALRLMKTSAGVKRWASNKKQRDGGKAKRAVIGVMRRLAMAAYQVGACRVAFDAERLFAGGPSRGEGCARVSARHAQVAQRDARRPQEVTLEVALLEQRSFFSRERSAAKKREANLMIRRFRSAITFCVVAWRSPRKRTVQRSIEGSRATGRAAGAISHVSRFDGPGDGRVTS